MNAYLNVLINKIKSLFSKRISISATVFNSSVSKKSAIKGKTRFYNGKIGDYSFLGRNCLIQNTSIGKFVSVSDNCNIGMPSHPVSYVSTSPVFLSGKNVLKSSLGSLRFDGITDTVIGNDVWIGYGASVKSGVKIGDGAIIGAGAIVTHDVPPYEIWAGNPARLIRKRFDSDTAQKLLELRWWDWTEEKLRKYSDVFCDAEKFVNNYAE